MREELQVFDHAKNRSADTLPFADPRSEAWILVVWTVNPGKIPWHRRMAWCFYPINVALKIGGFSFILSVEMGRGGESRAEWVACSPFASVGWFMKRVLITCVGKNAEKAV